MLAGRRCPEAGAITTAQLQIFSKGEIGGSLVVGSAAKVAKILRAQSQGQHQRINRLKIRLYVQSRVGSIPAASGHFAKARKTIGSRLKPLAGQRLTDQVGLDLALDDLKGFVATFGPCGQEYLVADRVRNVEVQVDIRLDVVSRIEQCRRIGPHRGIHGIEDEVVRVVAAIGRTQAPTQRLGCKSLQAQQNGFIRGEAAEAGREATGKHF